MTIKDAIEIAESQFTWEILFVLLFAIIVTFLIKTSSNREKKLMSFYEKSKEESQKREERLMQHLDKTTAELTVISKTVSEIQKEMMRMNDRMAMIEKIDLE